MAARRLTVGRASHAQTDLSRSGPCHDLSRSGHLSQSWGTPCRQDARTRPTMVRRGHPCAHGDRRAPHGRPHGPRARAQRSGCRPLLVQRRASAPRPPAPRLRRTRVLLPGPLSHGWWGCQGTRAAPAPVCAAHPARPRPHQRRGDTDRTLGRRDAGAGQRPRRALAQSWGAPV